jgi:hypothetical protein
MNSWQVNAGLSILHSHSSRAYAGAGGREGSKKEVLKD